MCIRDSTTATVLSWAFECYEKGLITKKDTDGLELAWGNGDAMVEMVERLTAALELYRDRRRTSVSALALAVLVHVTLALDLYCIGKSYDEHGLRLRDYFLTTQVSNVAGAIPVTPGGVGTRDATTVAFFRAMNARPQKTRVLIPLTLSLVIVSWGLVGAVVFIASPSSRAAVESALDDAENDS